MLFWLLLSCGPPQGDTFGLSRADKPADTLIFNNATEPEYLDPGLATGAPDGRIIRSLFDGLTESHPEHLTPQPGAATEWETHADGRGYTFTLREDATWSDGTPVTAHDYTWSWERVLHSIYLSRYAQQIYAIQNAQLYNQGRAWVLQEGVNDLEAGTAVRGVVSMVVTTNADVEIVAEEGGEAIGTLPLDVTVPLDESRGDWSRVSWRDGCPDLADQGSLLDCDETWRTGWVPTQSVDTAWPMVNERVAERAVMALTSEGDAVEQLQRGDTVVLLDAEGGRARVYLAGPERWAWVPEDALVHPRGEHVRFAVEPLAPLIWPEDLAAAEEADEDTGAIEVPAEPGPSEPVSAVVTADQVFQSPEVLGFRAVDDHTLQVRLEGVAPYFLQQTDAHYTLRAAPRQAIEAHGSRWTRPENIVTSGPFHLTEHRVRDKIVLTKKHDWWGADTVQLETIIAYGIEDLHTSANLYRAGYTDLVVSNNLPAEFIPILQDKSDFSVGPAMSVYYYRFNVTVEPLDDPRVRRALSLAVDRRDIVDVLKAGQIPATGMVPPGIPGYEPPAAVGFDPEEARRLLAEAGYPDGEGFPELRLLYNTLESHKLVAAIVQDNWQRHLGIDVQLENREWKTYLKSVSSMQYQVARAGWIGDYLDPNTFLDMWITDGGNNNTGWSNPEYDALISAAGREPDPQQRMQILHDAEATLLEEAPVMPLYWYVWAELRQPEVRGYHTNLLDVHPFRYVWLDR